MCTPWRDNVYAATPLLVCIAVELCWYYMFCVAICHIHHK